MKKKLLFQASTKFLLGLLIVGLLLFWPAGTIYYWNGWLFIGVLFIPMIVFGLVLWVKAPDLLEKRLRTNETEEKQKQVIGLSIIIFVGGFIVAGLDYRYGGNSLPNSISYVAAIVLLISYGLYMEVTRENAYLSRTIEVQENQTVVDTGLYGIVRHPLYFVTVILFLAIPLILGSIYAFIIFLPYPLLLVKRIRNEEEVLTRELPGYAEYTKKVKYRLIPFIW